MTRLHRWLGIAVGWLLCVWLVSGIVQSFVPFPSLPTSERRAAAPALPSMAAVALPAMERGARIEKLRLTSVGGAPRWVATPAEGANRAFDAASGKPLPLIESAEAAQIAASFQGSVPANVTGPLPFDRWTVHDKYLVSRPMFRVRFDDAAGTELYVAAATGEVVQRTTARQRGWNYVGALLHWLNLGTLRAHFDTWHFVIRSLASIALLLVFAGLFVGIRSAWLSYRRARSALSPYRGLQRYHHLLGMAAGVVILWWLMSGWLSLDRGTLFSAGQPTSSEQAALRGITLGRAAAAFQAHIPSVMRDAVELEWTAFAGTPRMLVRTRNEVRYYVLGAGDVLVAAPPVDHDTLRTAAERAFSPARVRAISTPLPDDAYARRGAPFGATVRRLELDDAANTWLHIDVASGEVVSRMDASRRRYRWLVDGMHTLDFPWLNRAGSLWHALLLLATTFALLFVLTGIALAWRRVRRVRH
jgi:hypothetical protein